MRYLSLFSGIEAATCAWHPLGWSAIAFAEIESFPSAVLAYRWPDVPNLGDVTKADFAPFRGAVDVVVGGPPCQAFSVAGLRQSLDDDRGNMTLRYVRICDAIEPRYIVYENVPGILSTKDNAFGCLLAALVGASAPLVSPRGGSWTNAGVVAGPRRIAAWRVLDAQFFGVPQRRRRVFVVASPRDGGDPAAVLFERASLSGDPPPSRKAREDVAGTLSASFGRSGGDTGDERANITVAKALTTSNQRLDSETETFVTHSLRAEGFDASEDGTGRGTPLVAHSLRAQGQLAHRADIDTLVPVSVALRGREGGATAEVGDDKANALRASTGGGDKAHVLLSSAVPLDLRNATRDPEKQDEMNRQGAGIGEPGDPAHTLTKEFVHGVCAFSAKDHGADAGDIAPTLRAGGHSKSHANGGVMPAIAAAAQVRRLTPRECERLQGFPDDWTLVPYRGKPAADGPRYKALGNSFAVPVVRWIGERIAAVEALLAQRAA